jgi:FK506-binding nuclear protein
LVASVSGSSSQSNSNSRNVQGVIIEELQAGNPGRVAKNGDRLQMHYVGKLKANNRIFDSSKKPFSFTLGRGEVIKGWDIGCAGMMVGGKRRLTIPPEKGYGRGGAGSAIPGNATLVFEISLVSIR